MPDFRSALLLIRLVDLFGDGLCAKSLILNLRERFMRRYGCKSCLVHQDLTVFRGALKILDRVHLRVGQERRHWLCPVERWGRESTNRHRDLALL